MSGTALKDMFSNLNDLGRQRSGRQAAGFFIAYTGGMLAGIAVIAGLAGAVGLLGTEGEEAFQNGQHLGLGIAILYTLGLGGLLLQKRGMTDPKAIALVLLAAALAMISGLVSIGILAWLTTRPAR